MVKIKKAARVFPERLEFYREETLSKGHRGMDYKRIMVNKL
jgi:hypothetical protein